MLLSLLLAAVTQSDAFEAVKTAAPPSRETISAQWREGVRASGFVDFTDRQPARYATQAYLLYDEKYLYVAFHCVQSGMPITAAQRIDHAGVGSDDHVGFGVDTSGNGSRTYQFRVNPAGVHDESSTENARYAPDWESNARVDAAGNYDAFLTIPLAAIRAQSGGMQRWRFNFERFVAAANADQTWAYSPAMQSIGSVQYWPWLTGIRLSAAATRPKPQADAYVLQSAGSQAETFQNGIGQFEQMHARPAGLDVTYPFTDTLAFVGTLNPDFSNVEQDQTTIELQEFQKAYQEYRPFFAQGAQYINAVPQIGVFGGNSMFYSPSIGVFNRGLKVEGTAGKSSLGVLNVVGPGVDDTAAGYAYTADNGALSASAQSVLADHPGLRDRTTGLGLQRLNRHSGEFTEIAVAAEQSTGDGPAHDFAFSEGLQNQHFTAIAYYRDTSALYHPADGYVAVPDARGPTVKLGYAGTGSSQSPLLSYNVNFFADRYLASDGSVREADVNAFYNVQFKNLISLQGFAGPSELQTAPGVIQWFNRRQIQLGYRQGTPQPLTLGYTWGPFAGGYVQQPQFSDQRVFAAYAVSFAYEGNIERARPSGPIVNSQWLRRVAISRSFGRYSSIGVQLRDINGTGGFAQPGSNLSLLYQQRFRNQDLLYLEYGTPAAAQTLHRFIVKYVFHAGGESGT